MGGRGSPSSVIKKYLENSKDGRKGEKEKLDLPIAKRQDRRGKKNIQTPMNEEV